MIKVENIKVFNFEGAFRGLRNPLESWDRSDSQFDMDSLVFIGPKDILLAQRMINGGTDESKFMRQIFISMDITAPLAWWKEADTYKVSTVANSCSTMHKLSSTPIKKELFSFEGCEKVAPEIIDFVVEKCEYLRQKFIDTKDKDYWRALIEFLPNGWNQKRTYTFNYQTARAMYFARRNHKLEEWREFCKILESLPYGKELICYEKEKKNESN